MAWFNPRPYGRAPSSRAGKLLVLGTGVATVIGLSGLVNGGFAQSGGESPHAGAAAKKKPAFVPVCVQRHGGKHSKGDLNVLLKSQCAEKQKPLKLALWPVKRKAGKQGAQGPAGPQGAPGAQGPAGPQGAAGAAAPTIEYGVATVYVDRGSGPKRFAAFSAVLGPMGTTTGGHFRFTCTADQEPCKVSLGAAVISSQTGTAAFYPRLVIHKEDANDPAPAPMTFCEYADGANNQLGVDQVERVPTAQAAVDAMRETAQTMGIGGSLDCGAGQPAAPPVTGAVDEIWVPAGGTGRTPSTTCGRPWGSGGCPTLKRTASSSHSHGMVGGASSRLLH